MPTNPQTATQAGGGLLSAALLASAGAVLDAAVYLRHGHVFINAMTGNAILLGVSAGSRDWPQAVAHLAVIGGFLLGLAGSWLLRTRPAHHAVTLTLLVEIVAVLVAGLPQLHLPNLLLTSGLALASAFQVGTFRRIGQVSYSSTFITGNLRDLMDGLLNGFHAPDPALRFAGKRKARELATICGAFIAGAGMGAWATLRFGSPGLWLAEPLFLAVLAIHLTRVSAGRST